MNAAAHVWWHFVSGAVFRVFPDVPCDAALGRVSAGNGWNGEMRLRTIAARAVTARASPKTERAEDQLRIAEEILEALRDAGFNAELCDGATGLADKRLN